MWVEVFNKERPHCRASNLTDLSVKKRKCAAKYGVRIRSLHLRICARAFLIAQLHKPKMAEPVISESESCYTTRTTNTSGSTSSALEEMQSRGSESEAEDQGADRCLTLPVRLTCETRVPRVFVR